MKAKFPSIEAGKAIEDTRERLRSLLAPGLDGKGGDKANRMLWASLSQTCLYAARRDPRNFLQRCGRGSRRSVGFRLGAWTVRSLGRCRRRAHGQSLGARREGAVAASAQSSRLAEEVVLRIREGKHALFRFKSQALKPVLEPPGIIILKSLKERSGVVQKNAGASLIDLGDGVLCCEFHSKMNSIGGDLVAMIHAGITRLSSDFDAMVIGNQATNFSVGANLMLVLISAQEGEWDDIHMAVRQFQRVNMAIKYAPRPIVAAPQGMALGGGCASPLAFRAHPRRSRNLHRPGGNWRRLDSRWRWHQRNVDPRERTLRGRRRTRSLPRAQACIRKYCHGQGFH